MQALIYILVTSVKNILLELRHKPAKLILYVVGVGGMMVLMLSQMFSPSSAATEYMDIIWLKALFLAMVAVVTVVFVKRGLSNGDAIFEMRDVNLLFVSPVNAKYILIYGLIQMIKGAFLGGFFMLFMGGAMRQMFGKGFDAILVLFFSFMLVIMLLSILSLVIYSVTNSRPNRKRWVKALTVAIFVPVVVVMVLQMLETGNPMVALMNTLESTTLSWTPIVGWSAESAMAFINGSVGKGLLFVGVMIAAFIVLLSYILIGQVDYYEDVLVATETAFEKKRSIAEGQTNPEAIMNTRTKVAKTGVGGNGASTFFYKHMRESTRASMLGLLSMSAIYMIVTAGVAALVMRNSGGTCMIVLQILMWMQVFMIGTGRGLKETMTHYIYMIPDPSFSKIIWSNLEPIARVLLEGTLIFGLAGLIGKESPVVIAGCIAVFTLFSMMLLGINYLSMRCFGTELGAGILIMIYMLIVVLLIAPGLVAAIVVAAGIGGTMGTAVGLGILSLWELVVALGCFALSKGVLQNCDMPTANK